MPGRFYIAPNSTIVLLRDVPIDQAQEHTLWFEDKESQLAYFNSKAAYTLTEQYYTRQGRGVVKAEAVADSIYDCNYMMYRNTSFGARWFFAFITSIEYTNNHTATITFKIDQMQTWFIGNPTATLGECFVEREHALTDVVGDNLIPEGLEPGEYVYTRPSHPTDLDQLCIVVGLTEIWDIANNKFIPVNGGMRNGLYSGIYYFTFNTDQNGITSANNLISVYTEKGKSDAIVSIFMAPYNIMNVANNSAPYSSTFTYYARPTDIDGYTPHNNKLFTSPYMEMLVKTPTNAAEYAWEYFVDPYNPTFEVTGNASTSPSIMLVPRFYKTADAIGQSVIHNYPESITLTGFPLCSYNIDVYKAWLAQNGASLWVNGALATVGLGLGIAKAVGTYGASEFIPLSSNTSLSSGWTPPWTSGSSPDSAISSPGGMYLTGQGGGTILGSLGAIGNMLAQVYQHSILPAHAMGNADGNISMSMGIMNFMFYTKRIRKEYAKIIDEYFDKFGYATHRIKVPNIHARTYWTYTKTVDCILHGNIPTEAVNEIQSIFNHGVTFWADPSIVGQYSTYAATNLPLGA